jgi:hypothetical protein
MGTRLGRFLIGVLLVVTPPALVLLSAAMSVERERHVRDGRLSPAPYWETVLPIALIACFIGVPLGAYFIFKACTANGSDAP